MSFKPHIEGLRALAILPILLFHLESKICPGGFLGVDVFFVISGYLITGLILAKGPEFDFTEFYVRRFFRLFPALLVTIVVTLAAGWNVLSPQSYIATAYSGLASALAAANIYFWATIDYFDADVFAHPLLHAWSLAVEEQFYLVWPALLLLAARMKLGVLAVIAAAMVASYAALALAQTHSPQAGFYLMPFRIFEFGFGAALVILEPRLQRLPPFFGALGAWTGLAIVVGSAVWFDSATAWPGPATLPCLVGTSLLILYGSRSAVGAILGTAILRLIGRISYSVYLVHWPLISLYRTYAVIPPTSAELVMLGVGSLVLGALLYATIEVPFRLSHSGRRQEWIGLRVLEGLGGRLSGSLRTSLAAGLGVGALACSGLVTARQGFPSRLDSGRVEAAGRPLTFAGDICSFRRSRCAFGDQTAQRIVHLVGDSTALNWAHGLDVAFRGLHVKAIGLYDHGCLFAYGTQRFQNGVPDVKCGRNVAEAYAHLARNRDPVIIAADWAGYRNAIGPNDASAPLRHDESTYFGYVEERMAAGLIAIGVGQRAVVIVKSTYSTGVDLAKCRFQPAVASSRTGLCQAQSRSTAVDATANADRMLERLAARFPSIVLVDPKQVFCPREECIVEGPEGLYFRDAAHLTNEGSRFLVEKVKAQLFPALFRSNQ